MTLSNWQYKKEIEKEYLRLVDRFGLPSYIVDQRGGLAIWLKDKLKDTPFVEMLLRDEYIPHHCPATHHDFLYSYVKVEIRPPLMLALKQLSGSVFYDGLKKLLGARCQSIEANIATLKIATDIINGNLTIEEIHQNELYGKAIQSTRDPKNVEILYGENRIYLLRALCTVLSPIYTLPVLRVAGDLPA